MFLSTIVKFFNTYWGTISPFIYSYWFRTTYPNIKYNLKTIIALLKFFDPSKITSQLMITYWLIGLYNFYYLISS